MMCYYVSRKLTTGPIDFDDKVSAIRNFVHQNVRPVQGYHNRLDTITIEKLVSGIGWCDQQSRVFMKLACDAGITTRLLFLRLASGSSPHSVAEALEPNEKWILVDSAYNLDLVNKDGSPASQSDIKNDPDILKNNSRIKLRSKFSKRLLDDNYLAIYSNVPEYIVTKKGLKFDLLKWVPLLWIRPVVHMAENGYARKFSRDAKDVYEFKIAKARISHLLDYYQEAEKIYLDIIRHSKNVYLIHKAEYYYILLLNDEKKYYEAYAFVDSAIKNSARHAYTDYLYGLRAKILTRMNRVNEAEQDLVKIKYSMDAS